MSNAETVAALHRLSQAEDLIAEFEAATGYSPRTPEELERWLGQQVRQPKNDAARAA